MRNQVQDVSCANHRTGGVRLGVRVSDPNLTCFVCETKAPSVDYIKLQKLQWSSMNEIPRTMNAPRDSTQSEPSAKQNADWYFLEDEVGGSGGGERRRADGVLEVADSVDRLRLPGCVRRSFNGDHGQRREARHHCVDRNRLDLANWLLGFMGSDLRQWTKLRSFYYSFILLFSFFSI